jgi:hypothetical protein
MPATGLIAQQPAPVSPTTAPVASSSGATSDFPKLDFAVADAAAEPVHHFFTASQFAALQKLGGILTPGAIEASAPEFLDFLLSQSPSDRQQLYRAGLEGLNAQARRRFTKPFADLDADEADELLAPLRERWTYQPPADPVARFLLAAKLDLRTATKNSLEWNTAAKSGARRPGPSGLYWYPID